MWLFAPTDKTGATSMKLEVIKRQSAVEQVVERITTVIREQKLAAGERLPGEFELVEQLQVSRPVLREALARLQSMGLVDIQRGRGTFVGDTSSLANCVKLLQSAVMIAPQELLSYAEMRTAIEIQAVRQAAKKATPEDVLALEAILTDLDRDDLPYPEHLEIDFNFHRKLVEMSGNVLMQNIMEVIYEFVLTQMARTTPRIGDNELGRRLHREIVTAVKKHDVDAADRAMREHMEIVLDRLRNAI